MLRFLLWPLLILCNLDSFKQKQKLLAPATSCQHPCVCFWLDWVFFEGRAECNLSCVSRALHRAETSK